MISEGYQYDVVYVGSLSRHHVFFSIMVPDTGVIAVACLGVLQQ